MPEVPVRFPSGGLSLEGVMHIPAGEGPFPAVMVCHPHPLYGGSMENNVVNSLCQRLVEAGLIAFKFNFRGVGGSEGRHSQGEGEAEDVRAAVDFVVKRAEVSAASLGIAGYSAGAGFALPTAVNDPRVKAFALVSLPLTYHPGIMKDCTKPKFLITGSRDGFVPREQFLDFCQALAEPRECVTVAGADHFWWGREAVMAQKVTDFLTAAL